MAVVAFSAAGAVINTIVPYLITAVGFWIFAIFSIINFLMMVPIYLFYVGEYLRAPTRAQSLVPLLEGTKCF